MNKKIFQLALFFVCFTNATYAQNNFDIKVNKTAVVRIEPCTNNIFRIRVSTTGNFSESLMERYGIIKTDWPKTGFTTENKGSITTVSTKNASFKIDTNTGSISLFDKSGKVLIEHLDFIINSKYESYVDLKLSLNNYFGKEIAGKGIIGDTANLKRKTSEREIISENTNQSLLSFSLNSDERFYGLGSAVRDRIQHRGTAARIWVKYQKAESPMPFIMSTNGWGVFYNSTKENIFDIGRFDSKKMMIVGADQELDFYLFTGSMPEILDQYTTVTGKPFLMPKYAYGFAFGSNTMENQFNVLENALRFREYGYPCDIYWLEPQWMEKMYDFTNKKYWNRANFRADWPEFQGWEKPEDIKQHLFVHKLNSMGFKLGLWLCVEEDLSIPEEMRIAKKNGKILEGQEDWFKHLTTFLNDGACGYKVDPGRTIDEHPDRKYLNGKSDKEMHQLQQVLVAKNVNLTCRDFNGKRPFLHYCGGYAGIQHWTALTSGDNGGGRKALFDQLNLGMSGHINTSCDILEQVVPMQPGIHFGFFLPWTQLNSWAFTHHPWFMSNEEKKMFKFYGELRYSLIPYIYSTAIYGSLTGMPILRAMPIVYPNALKVANATSQYMFGDFFLVGAFTDSIYLPEGNWIDYWSGKKFSGKQSLKCQVPADRGGPLFVKCGAIIPKQKPCLYVSEIQSDTLLVQVFPEGKSTFTLYEDDGISFNYEKGEVAKTVFDCIANEKQIEFKINPVAGKYDGIPNSRVFICEIQLTQKPEKVLINGDKTANWSFDPTGKLTISVHSDNKTQVTTIFIN